MKGKRMRISALLFVFGVALTFVVGMLVKIDGQLTGFDTAHPINSPSDFAVHVLPNVAGSCNQGSSSAWAIKTNDLNEVASDWGVYCEGSPTWTKENSAMPSIDGQALRCSIMGGLPYSNVHCYRNLAPEPLASIFKLNLSFWYSPTSTCNNETTPSVIQGLEFTMNQWYQSRRYEFALQWQNVGNGAPQWRYWDPHQPEPWVAIAPTIEQCLQGAQWHNLELEGEIVNDQVDYKRFVIDQEVHNLNLTIPPFSTPGEQDRLAVAIQLDGNSTQSPYDVFIDSFSFARSPRFKGYFPLIVK